ncbi:hypothetical protein BN1723_015760 [Verticillium longisporum]|uniref:Uncharacterized protein n=1 Tax=Verticillium longisporum TaxID=100787 RepID=A0A0G4N267_VERLO|nr:hypothetical protein BN1723_015760 [Verticillium longisporum]
MSSKTTFTAAKSAADVVAVADAMPGLDRARENGNGNGGEGPSCTADGGVRKAERKIDVRNLFTG